MRIQKGHLDRKFLFAEMVCCAVCFAVHVWGVQRLYSPFLYPEEMGYWANAAVLTGHDWSYVIQQSGAPWYTYGYSLVLVPLFWLFDDMVSMYRAAIILNALWATLSLLICFSIAKRFGKGLNRYSLLLASFVVSLYSAYIHQAKIAVVETFLYFAVWLLFLSFIRYEEKPSNGRGVWLGCLVSCVYIIHNRTVGVLVAFGMTVVLMLVRRKIGWKDLAFLLAPVLVFFVINQQMVGYFSRALWGTDDMSSADYSLRIGFIARLFTDFSYFVAFIKSVIGKLWYAFTASFMLCLWGLVYAAQRLWKNFKEPDSEKLPFSIVFFLLTYMGATAISALTMNNATDAMLSRRIDAICYGRYAEYAVGVFLLFGVLKLFAVASEPHRQTALMVGGAFVVYAVFSLIVVRYADQLIAINDGNVLWPTTQVNSTPGLFFFMLMGPFSFENCSWFAAAVSVVIVLAFMFRKYSGVCQTFAGLLTVACFVITGYYSSVDYTFAQQNANGRKNFRDLVDAVESNLSGKKVFVMDDSFYVYFDFQNNMIHNKVYCGGGNLLNEQPQYDVIVSALDDYGDLPRDDYRIWLFNSEYLMLCENSLADELHLPRVEINDLTYDFGEIEFFDFSGFGGIENGFRWSTESPATIELPTLERGLDYTCTVYLGAVVPTNELAWDSVEGNIVINDREEDRVGFTLSPGQTEFTFELDGDLLNDGQDNVMDLYSPLWSPVDFGSPDARTLGIAIDKIVFEKTG